MSPVAHSLAVLVKDAAREHPGQAALVVDDTITTYAELASGADTWAQALTALGQGSSRLVVGLMLPNSSTVLELLTAADEVGADVVPINTRYVGQELAHIIRDAGISVLVVASNAIDLGARLRDALPELATADPADVSIDAAPHLRVVLELNAPSAPTPAAGDRPALTTVPGSGRLILYTSGTTSRPKGCVIRITDVVHRAGSLTDERFGISPEDRVWVPLPMFHVAALLPICATLLRGGTALSLMHFDPEAGLDLAADHSATILFAGFPTIADDLVNSPRFNSLDLDSVRIVHSSGTPEQLRRLQAAFPRAVQTSPYGCTEALGLVAVSLVDDDAELRATTAGPPFSGLKVAIADLNRPGNIAADGEVGEILIGGEPLFLGYLEAGMVRPGRDAEGWLHTEDLGKLEGGRLQFRGRLKDMLKVGGENVAALEVEEVLNQHSGVVSSSVVGVPDLRLGEVPVAFVQLSEPVEAEVLQAFVADRLASFKVPRSFHEMSEWPMSATKVDKKALRSIHAAFQKESP